MQAQGALCFAVYCAAQDIRHPAIIELTSHLLDLLSSEDLPSWEQRGGVLALPGRGDPVPDDVKGSVPPSLKHEFAALVQFVVEIGIADMYAASSDRPKQFLCKSVEILQRHEIEAPNVSDLLPADLLESEVEDHWGAPIPEEASAAIRKCCRDLLRS